MQKFKEQKFNLPTLKGISGKNIEEHLKLYAGYVKNANLILDKLETLGEESAYEKSELQRRFAFGFGGMRNHEYYFSTFENGPAPLSDDSVLKQKISEDFGSFDAWLAQFKKLALSRGIGWAMLYYDKKTDQLLNQWVDEQHIGHLVSCSPVLALDIWEHAFVYDYPTSEKAKYVEAFFENLNWSVVENHYQQVK